MVDFIGIEQFILLTLANVSIIAWLTSKLFGKRLKTVFFGWASEFKNDLLAEIEKNPEFIIRIMAPALKKLASQYGIPEPGAKGGSINVFGMKIPRELIEFAGPILGGMAKKGIETAAGSPFG